MKAESGFNEESTEVKNILNIIGGDSLNSNDPANMNSSELSSSYYDNESPEEEAIKLTENLEIIADSFHKKYLENQKELINFNKKCREKTKIYEEQNKLYTK